MFCKSITVDGHVYRFVHVTEAPQPFNDLFYKMDMGGGEVQMIRKNKVSAFIPGTPKKEKLIQVI